MNGLIKSFLWWVSNIATYANWILAQNLEKQLAWICHVSLVLREGYNPSKYYYNLSFKYSIYPSLDLSTVIKLQVKMYIYTPTLARRSVLHAKDPMSYHTHATEQC